jgi:hypothetical protein
MPYITTSRKCHASDGECECLYAESKTLLATDTLGKAQAKADDIVAEFFYREYADCEELLPRTYYDLSQKARELPESGGMIGPLPDGTLIEVYRVSWSELERIIDAYNNAWQEAS